MCHHHSRHFVSRLLTISMLLQVTQFLKIGLCITTVVNTFRNNKNNRCNWTIIQIVLYSLKCKLFCSSPWTLTDIVSKCHFHYYILYIFFTVFGIAGDVLCDRYSSGFLVLSILVLIFLVFVKLLLFTKTSIRSHIPNSVSLDKSTRFSSIFWGLFLYVPLCLNLNVAAVLECSSAS